MSFTGELLLPEATKNERVHATTMHTSRPTGLILHEG